MEGWRCAWSTADFKSNAALEALCEQHVIHKIAKRYQVHAGQVTE
jgi:transposase-like protein